MILKIIKEEWRKNSTLYRGRSFAAFPVTIFAFAFLWNYMAVNYSTISINSIGTSLVVLSGFMGLAVGTIGFSSKGAFRNVLGKTNYLVYSSHTLPVSRKKLFAEFLVKDVFYYLVLVVIPVSLGFLIPTDFVIMSSFYDAIAVFMIGVLLSTALTLTSLSLPSIRVMNYSRLDFLTPIGARSVLDLFRSSGGILKVLFSLGLLTVFYWTLVIHFPMTGIFLNNPLLSYSVILGLLSLSVYNWLNRFDSMDEYGYLPEDIFSVVRSKEEAYLATAVPLSVLMVLISALIYPGEILLSVLTAICVTVYNMAVAVTVTGLKPNEKLFQADIFLKYLFGAGAIIVPLLYLSVIYSRFTAWIYLGVLFVAITGGLVVHWVKWSK